MKKSINAGGLNEIEFEGIIVGDKDFSALISKIKEAKADALYFGGVYIEGSLILRQMRQAGMKTQMIGGDARFSTEFAAIAGSQSDGTIITFGPDARKNPAAADAIKHFVAKNIDPEGYTLYALRLCRCISHRRWY